MKRSLLTTTTLVLIASFAAVYPLQSVNAEPSQRVEQQTASNTRSDAVGVLYRYFNAIAAGDYEAAYNLLTPQYRAAVPYQAFVQMYQDHIGSISILAVEPLSNVSSGNSPTTTQSARQEFMLQFNVSYIKPFPAGNGRVPELFVLTPSTNGDSEWLIDGMAPGQ